MRGEKKMSFICKFIPHVYAWDTFLNLLFVPPIFFSRRVKIILLIWSLLASWFTLSDVYHFSFQEEAKKNKIKYWTLSNIYSMFNFFFTLDGKITRMMNLIMLACNFSQAVHVENFYRIFVSNNYFLEI